MPHSPEYLRERLDYNPDTGTFVWRERVSNGSIPETKLRRWNDRFAGKPAGSVHQRPTTKYHIICIEGKPYQAHRIAWAIYYNEWPKHQIDHINQNGLDNRIVNLRDVPKTINGRNRKLPSNNTSGYIGVTWSKIHNSWAARIGVNGSTKSLGFFNTKEDAAAAYREAAKDLGFTDNHGTARASN